MDQETRRKLAGLLPMNTASTYDFTPDLFKDVDKEYQPLFTIKQFNNEQIITIKTSMQKDLIEKLKRSEMEGDEKYSVDFRALSQKNKEYMGLLNEVIVSWTNLYELGTGELFEYDGTLECMMKLPEALLSEVFSEAMKISGSSN